MCTSSPSAESALKFLNDFQNLFGLPRRLRSDQGSAFTSDLFAHWCSQNNVQHLFSPIGDHRGTGQVERLIRTLGTRLGACKLNTQPRPFPVTLHQILQDLRLCQHATTLVSPFATFFGRKPNTFFRNLFVSDPSRILEKGFYRNPRASSPRHLATNPNVSDTDEEDLPQHQRVPSPSSQLSPDSASSDTDSALEPLSHLQRQLKSVAPPAPVPSVPQGKHIFLKNRPEARSGAPVFSDITHNISHSTPHTF